VAVALTLSARQKVTPFDVIGASPEVMADVQRIAAAVAQAARKHAAK
jgi:hypothetical protein